MHSAFGILHLALHEEFLPVLVQEHPQRIAAERRAVRQQQQVHGAERQGGQPRRRLAFAQRYAHGHVREAPHDRDQRKRCEGCRRQPGSELCSPVTACRGDDRDGADAEGERGQSDERRQYAPDDEENAEKVEVRDQTQAADRMATRTSTRTDETCGELTRKRNRAPSATRAGTARRTAWWKRAAPVPRQRGHGSAHVAPRPPQHGHSPRIGTSSGTTRPCQASSFDSDTSADTTSASALSPRKASRMRSTTWPTDGKSMAISSAKHSCGINAR